MASVTSTSLPPATQFWVILAGIANNGATIAAECGFTIFISGPGVDVNGIDLDAGPDVAITQGGSTQLQGLAPNYNWSPPDGLSATNIADPIAAPVSTTLYTLTCYIGDCSYADQVLITVNDPISIAETDARSDITLFPIPGTDSFIALLPPGEHTITLFDASGRVALLQRTVGERSSVHTTHLPSGIYAVRLDDRFQVLRWVKE